VVKLIQKLLENLTENTASEWLQNLAVGGLYLTKKLVLKVAKLIQKLLENLTENTASEWLQKLAEGGLYLTETSIKEVKPSQLTLQRCSRDHESSACNNACAIARFLFIFKTMQTAHCALVVALRYAPDDPDFAMAKEHLQAAIALSGEYHKLYWSIFWKTSPEKLKRKIRSQCHELAFDTYSHMVELADLVDKYAAEQNCRSIPPPQSWREFLFNLELAFEWIEQDHSAEIYLKQLSLI
jgi:hypothetical protein